ncbi:MAG TPA: hypothetical protein VHZ55_22055 [Bryobacteraceae bacterium]|jgi:hypothetical protein|nr:hypothetical protein [Bryobacteraceae bacterium]
MEATAGSESASGNANKAHVDWFCDWIREGAERTAEMFTPPESAGRHFREARIEFLRGIRDLIDHRIDRLSRAGNKGTRVVVE